MTLRLKLIVAAGIALLALCGLGVLTYRWTLRTDEDQHWVEHTYTVLQKLGALSSDVISMEAARQNYVSTSTPVNPPPHDARLS
jgi:CHASE3 domain sensor protein